MWARSPEISTHNAEFLPRFQTLCESFGFKPTYLTNYEMAESQAFQAFGRDILKRGTGEIGMHLHAWNNPPVQALTDDDLLHHPYLIEYPEELMHEKIAFMTKLLEERFETPIVSHRAGRWSFNAAYARMLVEHGYRVDCSVTPNISWKKKLGDPKQSGGTDFSSFPHEAYYLDLDDIRRPGDSPLLELPMTILREERRWAVLCHRALGRVPYAGGTLRRLLPPITWMRPRGNNLRPLLRAVRRAAHDNRDHLEFMLHSSELMPGGSPTFPTEQHIEALYRDLNVLFRAVTEYFRGATLREHYQRLVANDGRR